MSHFAQIDENNVVQQVLVIDQAEIDTGNWGNPETWIKTSYNTRGGVYYSPDTNDPDPDQSKAFRKNYASIGFSWDGVGFIPPKSPFPSWVLNSFSYLWEAPVPMPVPNSPPYYGWNEATLSWVMLPNQPEQMPSTDNPGAAPNVIG
jgi:hypothetical protein